MIVDFLKTFLRTLRPITPIFKALFSMISQAIIVDLKKNSDLRAMIEDSLSGVFMDSQGYNRGFF